MTWEVTSAFHAELETFLARDWEPFAVTYEPRTNPAWRIVYHLRRVESEARAA